MGYSHHPPGKPQISGDPGFNVVNESDDLVGKAEHPICPFLGLKDDPSTAVGYPTHGNFCHRQGQPILIKTEQQRGLCLSNSYLTCPAIRDTDRELNDHPLPLFRQRDWIKMRGWILLLFLAAGAGIALFGLLSG